MTLKTRCGTLEKTKTSLETDKVDLASRLDDAETNVTNLEAQNGVLEDDTNRLTNLKTDLETQKTGLATSLNEAQTKVADLEKQVFNLKNQNGVLEVEKKCCPEESDNNCTNTSSLIQFNFETLVEPIIEHEFIVFCTFCTSFLNFLNLDFSSTNNEVVYDINHLLLVKLNKPILANIQSFLL